MYVVRSKLTDYPLVELRLATTPEHHVGCRATKRPPRPSSLLQPLNERHRNYSVHIVISSLSAQLWAGLGTIRPAPRVAFEEMASVSRKRKRSSETEAGPYVLQSLADDLPLAAESDDASRVEINCVEFWGQ